MVNRSPNFYWICQGVGWSVYSLTQIFAAIFYLKLGWFSAVVEVCLVNGLALGLTHLLRDAIKRGRWRSLPKGTMALRVTTTSLLLGIILGVVTQFTDLSGFQDASGLGLDSRSEQLLDLLLHIVNWAVLVVIWMALYWIAVGIREHKSTQLQHSELQRALQLAELRLLKSQLNPHFMFNALNVVRALIAEDPKRAQGAVTQLANTLRYTLSSSQGELVTLDHELSMVKDYLDIETLRFEDRLSIRCTVSADARNVRIPVMLLQTVVENAVKHGIAALPEGGELKIDGHVRDGSLLLEVENPRPLQAASAQGEGIGLRNAAERLRLLFGDRAGMEVDFSQPALATIRIRIPQGA